MNLTKEWLSNNVIYEELKGFDIGVVLYPDDTDRSNNVIHVFKKDIFMYTHTESCSYMEIDGERIKEHGSHSDYYGTLTSFADPLRHAVQINKNNNINGISKCILTKTLSYGVFAEKK